MLQTKNPKIIIAFYGTIIILFLVGLKLFTGYWNKKYAKYSPITKNEMIKKKIKRKRCEHGILLIDFTDSTRYTINFARNYELKPCSLCDFTRQGDSIIKNANNDTIIVKRKDAKYLFVINEELNKHLDKN